MLALFLGMARLETNLDPSVADVLALPQNMLILILT